MAGVCVLVMLFIGGGTSLFHPPVYHLPVPIRSYDCITDNNICVFVCGVG